MISLSDLWPPAGLVLRSGDLTLTPVTDDDLPGLAELALAGVHPADQMPFLVPWTTVPAAEMPRRMAQYQWDRRAALTPELLTVEFAVRRAGELVGTQGFTGQDYPILRTAETGSWLTQRAQGQGTGTRMRQAICALLFDHLGAAEVTSGAFLDNLASRAVSRKVGYRPNGTTRLNRLGQPAVNQRLVLRPEDLVRGDPVTVEGVEPLRRFLGLDDD